MPTSPLRRPRTWVLLGSLLLAASHAAPLQAQTTISATVGDRLASTDRIDAPDEGRHAPTLMLEVGRGWKDERARVFYGLDTGTFDTSGGWFYQAHTAGATVRVGPPSGGPALFTGGSGTWHGNGHAWPDGAYGAVGGFANLIVPRGGTTFRAGYRIDRRWFPELSGFDQLEHGFFGGVQRAFQKTRTTVIAELHGGVKSYDTEGVVTALVPAPGASMNAQPTGRGWRRGMGTPTQRAGSTTAVQVFEDTSTTEGLQAYGRVAQSVADRTAISVEGWVRALFGDVPPALATPEFLLGDPVYDDPFASEALTWRAGAKHVTARGWTFDAGVGHARKDYVGTLATDATGAVVPDGATRADRIWRGDAEVTVPLWPHRTGGWALDLALGYLYTRQSSNDAYYEYRSHRAGVALSVEY